MTNPISQECQHITALCKQKARCESNDTAYANTLERDISTAFKGEQKYIFEMLQNADDAGVEGKQVNIQFQLVDDQREKYLIISHTGKHFTPTDVDKISDNAQQQHKDKARNQEVIGYKGVGFKAIFSISDCVYIISKGYQFRFDKQYPQWKTQDDSHRFPWPIIPIWTEDGDIPKCVQQALDRDRVNFIIKLHPNTNIEDDLSLFIDRPEIMLFLRRVREICIVSKTRQAFQLRQEDARHSIYKNNQLISIWQKYKVDLVVDSRIKQLLQNLNAYECPERLKNAPKTSLTFALKLNENREIIPVDPAVLYTYLPTQVYLGGLPFIVNGDFLLDPSRTRLQDNVWNEMLIRNIAKYQFRWFASLNANKHIRFQILRLFKLPPFIATQKITEVFNTGFQQGAREIAFLPSFQNPNSLIKMAEARFDETGFFNQFRDIEPPENLLDYRLWSHHVLQLTKNITPQGLCTMMRKLVLGHESPEFQLRLFHFFKEKLLTYRYFLQNTPIILDSSNRFCLPREVYFPSQESAPFPEEISITLVHPELAGNADFKAWALQLGSHKMNTREIILREITKLIENRRITIHNAIPITRFIVEAFRANKIVRDDFLQLKNLPILTTLGNLSTPREMYLSDVYKPNLPLQKALSSDQGRFVSEEYDRTCGVELDAWRELFILLGVQQEIIFRVNKHPYTIGEGKGEKGGSFLQYLNALQRQEMTAQGIRDSHYFMNFLDCNILTHLNSVEIAKEFWNRLLQHWDILKNRPIIQYCMPNSQKKTVTISYVDYVIQNTRCVPATDGSLHFASEVFYQNSAVSNLLSVDLPVSLTKEQAEYFKFKMKLNSKECVEGILDLNKRKIKEVNAYSEILKILLDLAASEVQKDIGRKKIYLPSQSGELENTAQLRYFAVSNRKAPLSLYTKQWLKEFPGMNREELVQISNLFGIRVITEEDEIFTHGKPVDDDQEGKRHLLSRLPLIARVEAFTTSNNDEGFLLGRFKEKLEPIQFLKTPRMTLNYKGLKDVEESIFAYMQDQKIYTRYCWDYESTIDHFCKIISQFLGLSKPTTKNLREILKTEKIKEWLNDHQLSEDPLLNIDDVPALVDELPDLIEEDLTPASSLPEDEDAAACSNEPSGEVEPRRTPEETLATKFSELRMPRPEFEKTKLTLKPQENDELPDFFGALTLDSSSLPEDEDAAACCNKPSEKIKPHRLRTSEIKIERNVHYTPEKTLDAKPNELIMASIQVEKAKLIPKPQGNVGHVPVKSPVVKTELLSPAEHRKGSVVTITPPTQDIGRWGEEAVFLWLKHHYKDTKYRELQCKETNCSFKLTGTEPAPFSLEVVWVNGIGESQKSYDLKILKNGVKKVIEVKATLSESKSEFTMGHREFRTMLKYRKRYEFFRLYGAGSNQPRIVRIKNPAEELEKNKLRVKAFTIQL